MGLMLRQGSSGEIVEGDNDGDVLVWNATDRLWDPGAAGGSIAPGSYDGQPVKWNGAEYVPLAPGGDALKLDRIESIDSPSSAISIGVGGVTVQGETAQLSDNLTNASVLATNDRFQAAFNDGVAPSVTVVGNADGLQLGASALGFFQAAPVARPSITGATVQEQIDSLVSALVALGLVSDDR